MQMHAQSPNINGESNAHLCSILPLHSYTHITDRNCCQNLRGFPPFVTSAFVAAVAAALLAAVGSNYCGYQTVISRWQTTSEVTERAGAQTSLECYKRYDATSNVSAIHRLVVGLA